jgi:hypothetical protein
VWSGDLIGYIGKLGEEFYDAIGGMAGLTEAAKIRQTGVFLGGMIVLGGVTAECSCIYNRFTGVITFSRQHCVVVFGVMQLANYT